MDPAPTLASGSLLLAFCRRQVKRRAPAVQILIGQRPITSLLLSGLWLIFLQGKYAFTAGFFWTLFRHPGILKVPTFWVFTLSFEFFPWVLSFFLSFLRKLLDFLHLVRILNAALLYFCGTSGIFHTLFLQKYFKWNNLYKKTRQKCRKIELFPWVFSFFLEFRVFYPWVFSSMAKKQACPMYFIRRSTQNTTS